MSDQTIIGLVYRNASQGVSNYFTFHWCCMYIAHNEEKMSSSSEDTQIRYLCLKGWTSAQRHIAARNCCMSFCWYLIYFLGVWWELLPSALVCCHWCNLQPALKTAGLTSVWVVSHQYQTIKSFVQLHCDFFLHAAQLLSYFGAGHWFTFALSHLIRMIPRKNVEHIKKCMNTISWLSSLQDGLFWVCFLLMTLWRHLSFGDTEGTCATGHFESTK